MTPTASLHEDLSRDEQDVARGTDRAFGIVFAVVLALVAAFVWWRSRQLPSWAVALSAIFLFVALVRPSLLAPLNALWHRFGLLLHRITSPIVLGLMYGVAIVPVGLIMRLRGHDPLHRRFDPSRTSYWIERNPPGPPPASMTNQF
jgi:Saxitoxin biosynthesis operon protein SxtJ